MTEPPVSVIITNWNGKHFLEKCLSSLTNQTLSDYELILVDNSSTDGSVAYTTKRFKDAINLGPYYMNDFLPEFWDFKSSMFVKHECWALNAWPYTGAVISVYKDLDGTVHLAIWGKTGMDTYYAAMWFWSGGYTEQWNDLDGDDVVDLGEISYEGDAPGIIYLQDMNPGVTAINLWVMPPHYYILGRNIDTGNKPYVCIFEKLGTISEKHPHQCVRPAFEGFFVEGRGPTQTDRPTILQLPPELATVVNKYGD